MATSRALAAALLRCQRCCAFSSSSSSSTAHAGLLLPGHHCRRPYSGSASYSSLVFSVIGGGTREVCKQPLFLPSLLTSVRNYAKRPKKWQGSPYAWLPIPPEGEQVPPSRPNKGSVKNRNHQKRMAQRMEFAKLQAHTRREQQKAANVIRDTARRKRWKEGAERAKAWAQLQADRAAGNVSVPV